MKKNTTKKAEAKKAETRKAKAEAKKAEAKRLNEITGALYEMAQELDWMNVAFGPVIPKCL